MTSIDDANKGLSAYELMRLQKIGRNDEVLISLGLLNKQSTNKATIGRKKRNAEKRINEYKTARVKLPRSCNTTSTGTRTNRSSNNDIVKETTARNNDEPAIAGYILKAFAEESNTSDNNCLWDKSKHHQHLTISQSGRSVATTGCAGYGVALSKAIRSDSCFWEVHVKHGGVGGFALGVAISSAWKGPYKSIGRIASSKAGSPVVGGVYHSSGQLLTSTSIAKKNNGASDEEVENWGPDYGPGDRIRVSVVKQDSKLLAVSFFKNGVLVGLVESMSPSTGKGSLALAVQPYMGGLAEIIRCSKVLP